MTDRCNLRCKYCMPCGIDKISMSEILTYEEILKIAEAAAGLGIDRFKVTGGEPLVRKDVDILIRGLKNIPGAKQVTLTTNGELLGDHLNELIEAGLDSVNISLDSMDPVRYGNITGGGDLNKVMRSIDVTVESPITVKLNCVLHKETSAEDIISLTCYSSERNIPLRFIEMMPMGFGAAWQGMTAARAKNILEEHFGKMKPTKAIGGNGPASYYRLGNGNCIGLIGALSEMFCKGCNRVRLDSRGILRPCLCYSDGVDLRPYIDVGNDELKRAMMNAVLRKPEMHCFNDKVTNENMISIGG